MGQFKPMVKMMTTEPSVELKLKKGGAVSKADGGGTGHKPMQAGGMPVPPRRVPPGVVPARSTPALARAMAARRGMGAPIMKEGGESKAEHAMEMEKMASTEKKLQKHSSLPASKAHKGLKTGGVVKAQGGYKTGGVVDGQGGFKKGGALKKHYATGGAVNDAGHAVAMPKRAPSAPVGIDRLSGTFRKGGKVKMNAGGGVTTEREQRALDKAYDKSIGPSDDEMDTARSIRNIPRKMLDEAQRLYKSVVDSASPQRGSGSVTKTERSVTVSPAKKRGGSVKC